MWVEKTFSLSTRQILTLGQWPCMLNYVVLRTPTASAWSIQGQHVNVRSLHALCLSKINLFLLQEMDSFLALNSYIII